MLVGVVDTARAVTFGTMESRGNLIYKFVNAEVDIPILMQNLQDPLPKVIITHQQQDTGDKIQHVYCHAGYKKNRLKKVEINRIERKK